VRETPVRDATATITVDTLAQLAGYCCVTLDDASKTARSCDPSLQYNSLFKLGRDTWQLNENCLA
jgi:hypothetical protein